MRRENRCSEDDRTRRTGSDFETDAKLRAISRQILSSTVDDRLRQIEAEAAFFASVRRLDS